MSDISFQTILRGLDPLRLDAAEALAIAYKAGRRDEAACSRASLLGWRVAAGVLLAATLGLATMQLAGDGPDGLQQIAKSGLAQPEEAGITAPPMDESLRPLPGSYASLRSAVMSSEGIELGDFPGPGPGGPGEGRAMSPRDAL